MVQTLRENEFREEQWGAPRGPWAILGAGQEGHALSGSWGLVPPTRPSPPGAQTLPERPCSAAPSQRQPQAPPSSL